MEKVRSMTARVSPRVSARLLASLVCTDANLRTGRSLSFTNGTLALALANASRLFVLRAVLAIAGCDTGEYSFRDIFQSGFSGYKCVQFIIRHREGLIVLVQRCLGVANC